MSFFSNTDTGVTVNRFSQDLMLIDMELPLAALNTFAGTSHSLLLYFPTTPPYRWLELIVLRS
jgi:hypothetical protein